MLVMNFDLEIDTSIKFALEFKGLHDECFLFFFGKKVQVIIFGDGMNTGWCRNNLNHAKNQSEVKKKKNTRKSKSVLVCYEM